MQSVSIGEAISTPTFGLVKLVGALGLAANNSSKRKFLTEKINEFNTYLLNDEQKLNWWQEHYKLNLDGNSDQSFKDKYNPFSIADSVWKNKSYLSLEEMKAVIMSLNNNWKELTFELNQQKKDLERLVAQSYQAQVEKQP